MGATPQSIASGTMRHDDVTHADHPNPEVQRRAKQRANDMVCRSLNTCGNSSRAMSPSRSSRRTSSIRSSRSSGRRTRTPPQSAFAIESRTQRDCDQQSEQDPSHHRPATKDASCYASALRRRRNGLGSLQAPSRPAVITSTSAPRGLLAISSRLPASGARRDEEPVVNARTSTPSSVATDPSPWCFEDSYHCCLAP